MNKRSPYTTIPTTDLPWEAVDRASFLPAPNMTLAEKISYIAIMIDAKWPGINEIMLSEKIASSSPTRSKQKAKAMRAIYDGRDEDGGFKYRLEVIY